MMPPVKTLKLPALLLGLLSIPLLTACGDVRPQTILPPASRAEPVAYPIIPAGEAVCDGNPCLSDAQAGTLLADLAKALDEANSRLIWLRDYIVESD